MIGVVFLDFLGLGDFLSFSFASALLRLCFSFALASARIHIFLVTFHCFEKFWLVFFDFLGLGDFLMLSWASHDLRNYKIST